MKCTLYFVLKAKEREKKKTTRGKEIDKNQTNGGQGRCMWFEWKINGQEQTNKWAEQSYKYLRSTSVVVTGL